jgi:hypothetical protein
MTGSLEVSVGSRAGAPSSQACVPRAQASRKQHRANACMHAGFLRATVPSEPGDYKLTIDVVQESICWFSDQGSSALEFDLKVE